MIVITGKRQSLPALAQGQLWKLKHVYIHIVELRDRLLSYRMLDFLGQDGVRPKMSDIDVMWRYLCSRKAKLVEGGAAS